MKCHPYHLHPNPEKGRDKPLFVLKEGFTCPDCDKRRRDAKPRRTLKATRKPNR